MITSLGTKVSLSPSSKLPDGFTMPAYTDISDGYYSTVRHTLTILKATVENPDFAVTLLNIIQDNTVGIEKQIFDKLTTDFGGSNPNTIEYVVNLLRLNSNVDPSDKTSKFFGNEPLAYEAEVSVKIRVTTP